MIILNPLVNLAYFVSIGLDVVLFFLMVHVLSSMKRLSWLDPLNKVGEPLIEAMKGFTGRVVNKRFNLSFKRKSLIALIVLGIVVIKLFIGCLMQLCQ